MQLELTSTEEIVNDEEVTVWRIVRNGGQEDIILNGLFRDGISECSWLDEERKLISVFYVDWDGNEVYAMVNSAGEILRKGITMIEDVVADEQLFIIQVTGLGLGDEASDYGLHSDNLRMAVVNRDGEFVISPEYERIRYEEDEKLFYADTALKGECKFGIDGKTIS